MKKHKNHYDRPGSMDSIKPPEVDKIRALNDPMFSGKKSPEDVFRDDKKLVTHGGFERATKVFNQPERNDDEEEEIWEDVSVPKPAPEATGLRKGIKIGKSYVSLGKIVSRVVIILLAIVVLDYFFPAVFLNNIEKSGIETSDDPFKTMGLTQLKTYALANYSVYNEDAFSSAIKDNYKLVRLCFTARNFSPFTVKIPQYSVIHVDSRYKNNICYAAVTSGENEDPNHCNTIASFSSCQVYIYVMINVDGLSDSQIDEAVTSLVLCSEGMKKQLTSKIAVPVIPSIICVSDNVVLQ